MKKYLTALIFAVLGVVIATIAIIDDSKPPEKQPAFITPAHSPYEKTLYASGIVEASSGNIAIGTPVSGIVEQIFYQVGDHVQSGDALFKIDDKELQAKLIIAQARLAKAKVSLQKPVHRYEYQIKLKKQDAQAVSAQTLSDLKDELAFARAALNFAQAQVKALNLNIKRHIIRAPMDGKLLQVRIRQGEYVQGGGISAPLMQFGADDMLSVRADIDETEAWRFKADTQATAFVRGHPTIKIPLKFRYIEPLVVPKKALTGLSTERTDHRVLQVLYSIEPSQINVYVGQQLDVYINLEKSEKNIRKLDK